MHRIFQSVLYCFQAEGGEESKASINYSPNEEELVLDFPCQIQVSLFQPIISFLKSW